MSLMRFFRPKWQHPNPEVRRQAVEALGPDDAEVLTQVAQQDEVADVRKLALSRINDLAFLSKLVGEESDPDVRSYTLNRLSECLAGAGQEGFPMDLRLEFLTRHAEPELLKFVALQAAEPELRKSAQDKIAQQEVLGEVAEKDPVFANRLAALERISDKDILERVFRETRKHDKRINRLSREKLDKLKAEREKAAAIRAQSEALCARLEEICEAQDWEHSLSAFDGLDARWNNLAEQADEEFKARYTKAREIFLEGSAPVREARDRQEKAWAETKSTRQSILAKMAEREAELGALQTVTEAYESYVMSELDDWQTAWTAANVLPHLEAKPLDDAFKQKTQSLSRQLKRLKTRRDKEAALHGIIEEAQGLLDSKKPISENQVKSFDRRWEAEQGSSDTDLQTSILERYKELHKRLRTRLTNQVEKRNKEFEKLPGMLDELETLLNNSVLKEAVPMHDRLQSSLKQLQSFGMPKDKLSPFIQRLHKLTPQVRELQSWRTWGADEARERLCEDMESLIGSEEKPAELAARIRHLRSEWNRLRSDGGATGKTLRKRFDKAASEAYKPCEIFFNQQSEQRSNNLVKKLELLKQLEEYLETVEWSHMDWKAAVKFQRQISNDWRNAGPVDRRQAKEIDGPYNKAMGVINEHLELEHNRNLAQRRQLIDKVRALVEMPDINQAIDECKQLQSQWQTTVPGKRKLENEIWQEFREACDAVFARRKQEQDARHAEEQENKARKEEICANIEQLAQVDIAELEDAERSLHKLLDRWKEIGSLSKRDGAALEQRLEKAQKAYHRHKNELLATRQQAQMKLLQEKAVLCGRLEQALETTESAAKLVDIETSWKQLEKMTDSATEKLISQRYTKALDALKDSEGDKRQQLLQELQANLPTRQELCLRMEILSGVESPAELQQARMEFQANRLAEAMGQGEVDPVGKIADLERSWWLTGCAPTSEESRLQQRFDKALRANATIDG